LKKNLLLPVANWVNMKNVCEKNNFLYLFSDIITLECMLCQLTCMLDVCIVGYCVT